MMTILLKGGRIIDPLAGLDKVGDLLIRDGRIEAISSGIEDNDATVIDVTGKFVVPGLIDMHVHLRDPGYEWKEDIVSGTRAAARGGFTAVACMPNTNPVLDSEQLIAWVKKKSQKQGLVHVYPIGAITKGLAGQELAELGLMRAAGAVAFSDDGMPVMSAEMMRCAIEYAAMFDLPIISHCEDKTLVAEVGINRGYTATVLGLRGMPNAAEEVMIGRDIILAAMTGGRVHIAHVSTAGGVEAVRQGKARGIKVTAEACPHHFCLTEAETAGYNTNAKVNPPLRTAADVAAVREGLRDGTIDVIATDHAPHSRDEKEAEFTLAPSGISGLETAVGLVFTELVASGVLTVTEAIAKLTARPAALLSVPGGNLSVGAPADVTVIDPEREETVDPAAFLSKGKNTPFAGRRLKGMPVLTVVGGRIVMQDREVVEG